MRLQYILTTEADRNFKGLYNPDQSAVFPDGMVITAHRQANPLKQRVKTPSLVIIEFVLAQLPSIGTAGQLLYLSLAQSYIATPGRLHHELICFDLPRPCDLHRHPNRMTKIVSELQKRCVLSTKFFRPLTYWIHCRDFDHAIVIVHTHSDDTTGDLWYTSNDSKLQGPAAMEIKDVCIFICISVNTQ